MKIRSDIRYPIYTKIYFLQMETKTSRRATLTLESVDSVNLDDNEDIEYEEPTLEDNLDAEGVPDFEHDQEAISTSCPSTCTDSIYGQPVSAAQAAQLCPAGEGGLIYHAHLVSDTWTHPKDCTAEGKIKPRRATLPVRAKDFFSSLVQTQDGRWIFSGVLNGWPGLNCLEVRSITCVGKRKTWLGKKKVVRFWDAPPLNTMLDDEDDMYSGFGASDEIIYRDPPSFPNGIKSVRVTLRGAPWTAKGYSPTAPGCVWWFESVRGQLGPRLSHGEDMVTNTNDQNNIPTCTTVHHFAHRYARPGKKGHETQKQKLTYHGAILLEWNHGKYCTVVELATLNGVGGRSGKANWHHDKLEPLTELYKAM